MLTSYQRLGYLLRHLGPGWLAYRVGYAAQRRLGWFVWRCPEVAWTWATPARILDRPELGDPEAWLAWRRSPAAPRAGWAARAAEIRRRFSAAEVSRQAERHLAGEWLYFGHHWQTTGFPPGWHRDPWSGVTAPRDRHWSRLGDFSHGDIKNFWEPSRFAFAYTWARAYAHRPEERFAEAFWRVFEDWCEANPPQRGVNWKCGQETALRVMAWSFAFDIFLESPATTGPRAQRLCQALALSGDRIEANLAYALSQDSNHGFSEAAGLFTLGCLFPELRRARRWRRLGARLLTRDAARLLYPEGGGTLSSFNYLRFMLDILLWAESVGAATGHPLPTVVRDRMRDSALFLESAALADGTLPLYGSNDGAQVLPWSSCPIEDYRPTLQAVAAIAGYAPRWPEGPWNELAVWLGKFPGPPSPALPPRRMVAPRAGWHLWREGDFQVFLRCGPQRHRPGHADLLHVDVSWRGHNLLRDGGTYRYNAPAPFDHAFRSTRHHNTVLVDNTDQMERVGHFLLLPWPDGRWSDLDATRFPGQRGGWGEHDAYLRLPDPVRHRRVLLFHGAEDLIVLDVLNSSQPHDYRLQWLTAFSPGPIAEEGGLGWSLGPTGTRLTLACSEPVRAEVHAAGPSSAEGWYAPHYGELRPGSLITATARGTVVCFATAVSPTAVWSVSALPLRFRLTGATDILELEIDAQAPGCPLRGIRVEPRLA